MTNEKLEQITAEGKDIEVDGVTLHVNPLTTKQFMQVQNTAQNKNQVEALMQMMLHSLEEEDIDREGLEDAPPKLIIPIQEAIEEVNDFEDFFSEEERQEALSKLQ